MKGLLGPLCFVIFASAQLRGQVTVQQHKAGIASSNPVVVAAARIYVRGLGEGMQFTNAASPAPLFGPPDNLALHIENFLDIIDRQIKAMGASSRQEEVESTWIAVLLLHGLQETFPCPKAK